MRIFLIGYMGAGKTSTGRRLSGRLLLPFLDFDEAYREKYGLAPSSDISEAGEEAFRAKEHLLLLDVVKTRGDFVAATGGGLPCFGDNIDIINEAGISVYLKLDPRSLALRISRSKVDRPLISGLTGGTLEEKIRIHLATRERFYERANIIVKGENLDLDLLENKIRSMAGTVL